MFFVSNLYADWKQDRGPEAGDIHSLTISNDVVYAATKSGGVFKLVGNEFVPKNSGMKLKNATLAITSIENKIFAGKNGDGVFLSTDGGDTWIEKNN